MNQNQTIESRIVDAMKKQEKLPPRRFELGGGLYFKCYWMKCNEDLKMYYNYCPKCGQAIDWERGEDGTKL